MTSEEARAALRAALENDKALAARFAAATSDAELQVIAAEAGIDWELAAAVEEEPAAADVSDAELATVSGGFGPGGYAFPPTDWVYCDNPWTNVYCTYKC